MAVANTAIINMAKAIPNINRVLLSLAMAVIAITLSKDIDISAIVRHYKCDDTYTDCKYLFCNKTCSCKLTPYDIFELMCAFPSDEMLRCQEMESWIGIQLTKMDKKWIQIFMPWILQGCTVEKQRIIANNICLLYTSPSPRDKRQSRMPSSA